MQFYSALQAAARPGLSSSRRLSSSLSSVQASAAAEATAATGKSVQEATGEHSQVKQAEGTPAEAQREASPAERSAAEAAHESLDPKGLAAANGSPRGDASAAKARVAATEAVAEAAKESLEAIGAAARAKEQTLAAKRTASANKAGSAKPAVSAKPAGTASEAKAALSGNPRGLKAAGKDPKTKRASSMGTESTATQQPQSSRSQQLATPLLANKQTSSEASEQQIPGQPAGGERPSEPPASEQTAEAPGSDGAGSSQPFAAVPRSDHAIGGQSSRPPDASPRTAADGEGISRHAGAAQAGWLTLKEAPQQQAYTERQGDPWSHVPLVLARARHTVPALFSELPGDVLAYWTETESTLFALAWHCVVLELHAERGEPTCRNQVPSVTSVLLTSCRETALIDFTWLVLQTRKKQGLQMYSSYCRGTPRSASTLCM